MRLFIDELTDALFQKLRSNEATWSALVRTPHISSSTERNMRVLAGPKDVYVVTIKREHACR